MRVYFISNRYDGCQVVRCLHPMIHNGWGGDKTSLYSDKVPLEVAAREAMKADVVVFHRPDSDEHVRAALLLKKMGKTVVFDNDDTYKNVDAMKLGKFFTSKRDNIDRFIRIADVVTTTTEYLAKEYRELSDNVHVLKNCVDPMDWDTPKRNRGKKVRIGIFGSATLNGDFDGLRGILQDLSDRDDVQLVMFGLPPKQLQTDLVRDVYNDEFTFWESLDIEWQPFVEMSEYYDTLNSLELDITLIPRKDNYFNRCKSNLKFLEASMLEIPVIAQGFEDGESPYQGEDEPYLKLAMTVEDWKEHIGTLVSDKKLRRELGKQAKAYVLKNYNISTNAKNWKTAYENSK